MNLITALVCKWTRLCLQCVKNPRWIVCVLLSQAGRGRYVEGWCNKVISGWILYQRVMKNPTTKKPSKSTQMKWNSLIMDDFVNKYAWIFNSLVGCSHVTQPESFYARQQFVFVIASGVIKFSDLQFAVNQLLYFTHSDDIYKKKPNIFCTIMILKITKIISMKCETLLVHLEC